ncbi:amidase family protein [Herbiconiux sp. 11R-BC]|uniref:amidase family protein n=1 Tax=Herbiconiux sp. 11R-BC TaxID=3111637 RepID=UPI003C04E057
MPDTSAAGPLRATAALAHLDGTAMLAALDAREISAAELLEQHIALIEARNPELNAVVSTDYAGARAAAAEVDRRRASGARSGGAGVTPGEPGRAGAGAGLGGGADALGPLAGLPFTVKDSFDVRGLRTTQGRLVDSRIATVDAPAVARLRAAGAILLGKTNLPLFLADSQSVNDDFGRTGNPWDLARTPGGSSGGSAASVAAGFAAGEVGSDLAGSIRVPASWCGVFGHKPSTGTVSKQGHMPWPDGGLLEPPLSGTGPMARSAADLLLYARTMFGAAPQDAVGWRLDLPPARRSRIDGTRVGLWFDDPVAPVDAETRAVLERFAQRLEAAGCTVTPLAWPPVSGAAGIELFERLQEVELAHAADPDAPPVLVDLRRVWGDWQEQRRITAAWTRVFDEVDVVLAPTVPTVAPAHSAVPAGERMLSLDGVPHPAADVVGAWSRLANVGRGPSTVVPLGRGGASGLPVGGQLIGPYLEDFTPLQFAVLLEREGLLAFEAPPGW